ncbi:MAG TPA: ATP-binding protein, partial [Gaiellaceae bacterium]
MPDPPTTSWPLWQRGRAAKTEDAEYVALARYATTDALWGFDAPELPAGLSAPEIVARVYGEVLAGAGWNYVEEPKRPAPLSSLASQQIRTPRDIQRYRAATCLDASLLLTALAVRAGTRPHLAVGRNHAFVIVGDHVGGTATGTGGIAYASRATADLVGDGVAMAIDVVQALVTPKRAQAASFADALAEGQRWVADAVTSGQRLMLIDVVAANERHGFTPYAPDRDPTFIPRSLPAHAGALKLYESQESICERLRGKHGVIVIHGDSGSGKTTAALHLAAERESGPAVILDASSGETIVTSAAEVGARERGVSVGRLEPQERDGDAASLLARLSTSPGSWCVVFDNADGDPSQVLRWLPRPDREKGQAVIVTTTNPTWLQLSLVNEREALAPIDDTDVARALGTHSALAELVAGRAVTLRAFLRYLSDGGGDAARLQRHAEALPDDELRGPVALVSAVLEEYGELGPVLQRLELLPPDHLPICDDVADYATFQRLEALGLVDLTPEAGVARMHRLVGRAAERVLGQDDEARTAADMVRGAETFAALSAAAEPSLLERYTKLILAAFAARQPTFLIDGFVLQRAASLMELRGRVEESRQLAEPAVTVLGAVAGAEPIELADALQSLARWTNQHDPRNAVALAAALEQMALAQSVAARFGDERRAARSRRLEALLRLKVGWLNADLETGTRDIVAALGDLEREADAAERPDSGVDRGEALRARFNVAGPRVTLAQRVPSEADGHLREAQRVYEVVGHRRQALYPQTQHPHVAACISGEALARYMRANLVAVTYDERQRLLAEATDLEREALTDRFELEGPLGGADTSKSSKLLTKISYARHRLNDSAVSSTVLDEARGEIAVPRLTAATADHRAYAERWMSAPQLAAVLQVFGVSTPAALEPVAAERTIYDVLETRTILSAARALGLMDVALPVRRVYDQIVVLDGDGRFAERAAGVVERLVSGGEV